MERGSVQGGGKRREGTLIAALFFRHTSQDVREARSFAIDRLVDRINRGLNARK
jgi:hypothetical protein